MSIRDNRRFYIVRYKKVDNKGSFQICIFREDSTFYNVMQVYDIEKRFFASSSLDALESFLYSTPFIFPEGLRYYETNQGLGYDWVELNVGKKYPVLSPEWVKNHGYKSYKGLSNFYTLADSPLEALYQTIKGRGRLEDEEPQKPEVTSKLFRVDYNKVEETYTTECFGNYFINDGTKKDYSKIRPLTPNVIPLFIVADSYADAVTKAEHLIKKYISNTKPKSKFKCNFCSAMSFKVIYKKEETMQSDKVYMTTPIDSTCVWTVPKEEEGFWAECMGCGKTWGPAFGFSSIEEILKKNGVVS